MCTHLDDLTDDLYKKNYEQVHRPTLELAAMKGRRRQISKQGKITNHNVIWHWINDKPFKSLSMRTNGRELHSYKLCIGHTDPNTGEKVLRDYTARGIGFSSQTTSVHVNIIIIIIMCTVLF